MPPKGSTKSAKALTKKSPIEEAGAGSLTPLTPKEITMITSFVSLLKDMPDIDYDAYASLVGVKFTKNAKSQLKKLFGKMGGNPDGSNEDENSGDEASVPAKKKAPAKKAPVAKKASVGKKAPVEDNGDEDEAQVKKKAPVKAVKAPVGKKGVGKSTAPKKANSGGPKKLTKKQQAAADAKASAEAEEQDEETKDEDAVGKLNSFNPINGAVESGKPSSSSANDPIAEALASVINPEDSVNESAKVDDGTNDASASTAEEERDATLRGITVKEWREWKAANNYDQLVDALVAN